MMFGEVPAHIRKRHEKDVPSIGSLDDIVLPTSTVRYVEAEIITSMAPRDAVLDSSAKLDELTTKALKFYDDLLSEPPATDDPKILSAQSDAARTIMTTQLRVDDSRLKKRTTDTLSELLRRMEAEDARLVVQASR
jgi:hypothetical protein